MTREEYQALYTKIVENVGDQSIVSECLTEIQKHVTEEFDKVDKLNKDIELVNGNNENLRKVNMKLMLENGRVPELDPKGKPDIMTPDDKEPEETKIKIENLFNEKGELK